MTTSGAPLLGDVFDIAPVVAASDFVLQLQEGVQHAEDTIAHYVVTDSLATAFDRSLDLATNALAHSKDCGVFLDGSFGAGKSHFMAVLDLLLRGDSSARTIPGLQATIERHETVLSANLLTIEYHLIGAESLENALFAGYLAKIASLHPEARLPLLHRSDALFDDAASMRSRLGDDGFFAELNGGGSAPAGGSGSSPWGSFAQVWTPESYAAAEAADVSDSQRQQLAADLVATMFSGYTEAGQWLEIGEGLAVMAAHAAGLGYQGIVLFLDELVLWLASRLADRDFVSTEGSKVAKLVETGVGSRAIPLISFVARQRELQDFYRETAGVSGAERMSVGQSFEYWENRFDKVTLAASNLPDIAHRRLLVPRNADGKAAVAGALASLKSHPQAWDALLRDEGGSDEAAFAKVYPFSPALVDTLVFLSGMLQRERTALKVMAQLLADGREARTIEQIIPVADLFDALVLSGEQPLTEEVKAQFDVARKLYLQGFRPVLLASHGLVESDVAGLDPSHAFFTDDQLAKTLLVSALVNVPALQDLTASKLAALNHGSIKAFIPGAEATAVLTKVRPWNEQIAELEVGDGPDPSIRLTLTGVDYASVLSRVQTEDNAGARRRLIQRMVFKEFGVADSDNLFDSVVDYSTIWRGSQRHLQLVFGNVRDSVNMPDQVFQADGSDWRLIVDYPFDEGDHVPGDDLQRISTMQIDGFESQTVVWLPRFLSRARQDDIGTLVMLEYLLGGSGDQFESHAQHLAADQRPTAKALLENKRRALRSSLVAALKQAYGLSAPKGADIDLSHGDIDTWIALTPELQVQPPVAATLGDALRGLADQMLTSQYPEHPKFESEVRPADLSLALDYVTRAVADPAGRVDNVIQGDRTRLKRIVNPLRCGEFHESLFVFGAGTFPWRNEFLRLTAEGGNAAGLPVARIRQFLTPKGLTKETQNLLIAAWALLDDKEFTRHEAAVRVTALGLITDDLVLRDPRLPEPAQWEDARNCAASLFGVSVGVLLTAANVSSLCQAVRQSVRGSEAPCRELFVELQSHSATLGLTEASPRLQTAKVTQSLLTQLSRESDDMMLIGQLAGFAVPDEPQAYSRSISTAAEVLQSLRSAQWNILDSVAERTDPAAVATLVDLRQAAPKDEFHAPLAPALGQATSKVSTFLAGPRPPVPPPGPGPTTPVPAPQPTDDVNSITLVGVDDLSALGSDLESKIREAMSAQPGKTLHITWWLE